jgi:hypothetical protein
MTRFRPHRPSILLVAFLTLAVGCRSGADESPEVVATVVQGPQLSEDEIALNDWLATFELFVGTLENVRTPIDAWKQAEDAAAHMRQLETWHPDFIEQLTPEQARERYAAQLVRLEKLTERRDRALKRIEANHAMARVLYEEMAKADRKATEEQR